MSAARTFRIKTHLSPGRGVRYLVRQVTPEGLVLRARRTSRKEALAFIEAAGGVLG